MIYFDHNATTPLDEAVLDAMLPYMTQMYGNPSALHRLGRASRSAIDTAREQIANLIDTRPEQILFTSGGTEANALAMNSLKDCPLAISAIEHPSLTDNTLNRKTPAITLPVDNQGLLNRDSVQWQAITENSWVSVMMANNETGVIQDIQAISTECQNRGLKLHSDAVQALGKIDFSMQNLKLDMISLSSHKIYGPKGCGALIIQDSSLLKPLQIGGQQEKSLRAGTENVAGIVGFGKAAELAKQRLNEFQSQLRQLRDYIESQLNCINGIHVFSAETQRLPNTVQFAVDNLNGEMLLMQLDQQGFAVSSGSACKAGSHEISPVLHAMGIKPELARSAIRISLGKQNTIHEIDQFMNHLRSIMNHQH